MLNEFTHCSVLVNGIRLHYVTAGQGEPVVLLHGWPQTWYAWRKLIPLLATNYKVIALDMRGCGASSKPQAGYDKKTVATDIKALIDMLGYSRINLVGHDMGGSVGYAFAAQWPEHVNRFVFIESGLIGFGQERSMNVATGGSWHFGYNMAGDIAEELVRGREHVFVQYFTRRDTVGTLDPTSINDADIDEYARSLAQPGGLRGSFAYYRALFEDAKDNEGFGKNKLPMPVLAVGAEHGYKEGPFRTMQAVAENVHPLIIKESGHYPAEEQPKDLAQHLHAFFKEQ